LVVIAPGGDIVFANAEFARLTGYGTEELRGLGAETVVFEATPGPSSDRPTGREVEVICRRADNSTFPADVSLAPLPIGGAIYVVAVVRDETERRRSKAALAHRALHDPLTGLANRVLLLDRLEHVLARLPRHPAPAAVLYLDLDGFKEVNDRWGHGVGDEVLRVVAERLAAAVRPGDTVARFGGDEFVVLCEDVESVGTVEIARRLVDAVDTPIEHGEGTARVRASVGFATTGHDRRSAQELIEAADQAMYRAKRSGTSKIATADPGQIDLRDG
jgi:diguanylate cyclase (GGDEF)-like protein/PAS domain S-box-containing protein